MLLSVAQYFTKAAQNSISKGSHKLDTKSRREIPDK